MNIYSPAGSAVLEVTEPLGQEAWKGPLVIVYLIVVTKCLQPYTHEEGGHSDESLAGVWKLMLYWPVGT